MGTVVNDADGPKIGQKVDQNNRAHTSSIEQSLASHATVHGDSYNLNTGLINLTAATVSGIMYYKNDDVKDFVITAIAVGQKAGTQTDLSDITVILNPTSVSFSTAVDINQNRKAGSSNTLATTSLAYKGAEGATVTGGNSALLFVSGQSSRLFATVDLIIPRGQSLAITLDPNLSSGSMDVYAALIGYLRDTEND